MAIYVRWICRPGVGEPLVLSAVIKEQPFRSSDISSTTERYCGTF
jgi:hypothetical protein